MYSRAMDRTADPRVYAGAAKQSVKPSQYVMDNVKFTYAEKLESIPFQSTDAPIVYVPRFSKDDLAQCSWGDH